MILLGLSLILLSATAWVLMPLWRPMSEMPQGREEAAELEARQHQLLLALQDLDFEMQTGKLSPEDHQSMRRRLQGEAVAVLQELEQVRSGVRGGQEPPADSDA